MTCGLRCLRAGDLREDLSCALSATLGSEDEYLKERGTSMLDSQWPGLEVIEWFQLGK